MKKLSAPTALVILDGFGIGKKSPYNAIFHAHTPHLDYYYAHYPHTQLVASGTAVGLINGMVGNSETGHITIGSGRIVQQGITVVTNKINDGSFFHNKTLIDCFAQLKKTRKTVHLLGLLSDAGVHSHINHLYAFIKAAQDNHIEKIVIHAFLDGRDAPPKSATHYLQQLETKLDNKTVILGSISGRFYTMDRDNNWLRIKKSYDMLTTPEKPRFNNWQQALTNYYADGSTDEFIPPTLLNEHATIESGDGIIFFNVRPDRARQLTACFVDKNFDHFKVKDIMLCFFITPFYYSKHLNTTVLFKPPAITNTLKEVLHHHNKTIFSIAETEKYAHITYFFSGGKEQKYPHEKQMLIESAHAKHYNTIPEMSASLITDTVVQTLQTDPYDFYLLNYANADMVGHSGDFKATVQAIECLDKQLGILYHYIVQKHNGRIYITADHGNAEDMYDESTQQARTSHTTNLVPFIVVDEPLKDKKIDIPLYSLADIAPFILTQMAIIPPEQMTGSNIKLKG